MKAWTHLVLCDDTKRHYSVNCNLNNYNYTVKAVQKDGEWYLCERNRVGLKYGQKLKNVIIERARDY